MTLLLLCLGSLWVGVFVGILAIVLVTARRDGDRWDEGYTQAVLDLAPVHPDGRLLFLVDHAPRDNPYRGGDPR